MAKSDFVVAQLGARMHYAVPRVLHRAGLLERLFTDICATAGWPRLLAAMPERLQPHSLRRLLGRLPGDIPAALVRSFPGFGLTYARRIAAARSTDEKHAAFLWGGRRFCELVLRAGVGPGTAVYGFNSAALELLADARSRGFRGVLEQTSAPYEVEQSILRREREAYPEWEEDRGAGGALDRLRERQHAEWEQASLIVCPSAFVVEGVKSSGGPWGKCEVVPYGVDMGPPVAPQRRPHVPMRVLTVGAVCLQKGCQYVMEAARRMRGRAEFRVVGPVAIKAGALAEMRRHVEVVGAVERRRVAEHYQWADVFLLPSLCEGSATVCYEALASGLPVVCTPNTGSVVRDGVEGFVVPARDAEAIADRLVRLADPALLTAMSQKAHERSRSYTLDAYAERLLHVLQTTEVN